LDPKLLRTDLLRSIFYLHQQPPLFNLYLGLILKLFPTAYPIAFQLSFNLIGLCFSLYLFYLMKHMNVSRSIAFGLAVIFICSPTTVMYESWLFYTCPAAFLLCVSTYYLVVFLKDRKRQSAFWFFTVITILILTRATFRVEILCFFFLTLLVVCRADRKILVQAFIIPFMVLSLYSLKQYLVFDTIHASTSYIGRNLPDRIARFLSQDERSALSQMNEVPLFYFDNPNKVVSRYLGFVLPAETGIPALDEEEKSTGRINFNHLGYLTLSDAYMRGFFEAIKHYPMSYFKSFIITKKYFYPASQDALAGGENRKNAVGYLSNLYNRVFLLKFETSQLAWGLVVGLPTLLIFGCVKAWRFYARDRQNVVCWLTLCYIIFNIIFLSAITAGVSTNDFNRYRAEFDCLYVVLLGVFLTDICIRFKRVVSSIK
jgi:hypothetical protein